MWRSTTYSAGAQWFMDSHQPVVHQTGRRVRTIRIEHLHEDRRTLTWKGQRLPESDLDKRAPTRYA